MADQLDEVFAIHDATVTCETDNCDNKGIALEIKVVGDAPYSVFCGGCQEPITNIVVK